MKIIYKSDADREYDSEIEARLDDLLKEIYIESYKLKEIVGVLAKHVTINTKTEPEEIENETI